jgi:hypothetical protein
MQAYEGGVLTTFRLAIARWGMWTIWWMSHMWLKLCLRDQHPYRVYHETAYKEMRPLYLESLRHATGPRTGSLGRWKFAALALVAGAIISWPHGGMIEAGFNLASDWM